MSRFKLPEEKDLSPENKEIFKALNTQYGKVPNIFAAFASSDNGLANYFSFLQKSNSLTPKENEVVNLVVSEINECRYCLSFHTALAKRLDFSEDEIRVLRIAGVSSNPKFDALAKLTKDIVEHKGLIDGGILEQFYEMGYNQGHLVDIVLAIGNISTLNLLYAVAEVPIDWPVVILRHQG